MTSQSPLAQQWMSLILKDLRLIKFLALTLPYTRLRWSEPSRLLSDDGSDSPSPTEFQEIFQ